MLPTCFPQLCYKAGAATLDNWGHKAPTQSKRKRTGKKRLKGHGPEHVYNTLGYTMYVRICVCVCVWGGGGERERERESFVVVIAYYVHQCMHH